MGQGNANGNSTVTTPLSPGSESREKERVAVLLDINRELLYESMQLMHTKEELKKERIESLNLESESLNDQEDKPTTEEAQMTQDFVQYVLFLSITCMTTS